MIEQEDQPERREQRHSDIVLTSLSERFTAFVDRYNRDIENAKDWKTDTTSRLKVHCEFIQRVSPIYQRMMWVFGLITAGGVGLFVVQFFKHIHWQ